MRPTTDISLDAGENHVHTVTVTGTNLVGGSAVYEVFRGGPSGALALRKTEASGITLANGSVTITYSPADTLRLDGAYFHRLRVVTAGGTEQTLFIGAFNVARR